mgnify:CR=1 FL=1
MNKISVVTGTRAEYGLLSNLIKLISADKNFNLQLIVTGSHLTKKHGNTIKEIQKDKIHISERISILKNSDSPMDILSATSNAIIKIGSSLKKFSPEAIIILGDRFEILGAAISAQFLRIPIIHFHGGERTEGLIDEAIRHSITKMSALHFVANEIYKKRVIQLGENKKNIFNVGGMGIDVIKKTTLIKKEKLEKELKLVFYKKIFVITFHPVTLENNSSELQFSNLLKVLNRYKDVSLIFTSPNSDMNNRIIFKLITKFMKKNPNASFHESLGRKKYYSLLKICDLVIGNSSSGIIEVPYFRKPTINIGDRQNGRLKSSSIIDCKTSKKSLQDSIKLALSKKFLNKCRKNTNYYGTGGASLKSFNIIKKRINNLTVKKPFNDIDFKI